MKPLRTLSRLAQYVALTLLAGLIVYCPVIELCRLFLPRIPYEIRTGPLGFVLDITIQISAFACFLKVEYGLFCLILGPPVKQRAAGNARHVRKPPVLPVQTVYAAVSGKNIRTRQRPRSRPEYQYFAGFQPEGGAALWLAVKEAEYRRLSEGDRGQLTFQGKTCLSFQKDGEGQEPNHPGNR